MTKGLPINYTPTYYVKTEHGKLLGDSYWVYAHYPTTEPDVMIMPFVSKVNAELFCEVMNAENERREADPVKHGEWIPIRKPNRLWDIIVFKCSICGCENYNDSLYCPSCGAQIKRR